MMEDHGDSFYPGEVFVFITTTTTKPEELSVPRSEADPRKIQAEMFEKDPFVARLSWDSSDASATSLSADSPDRVRNPGKDPDIPPDCSRSHQGSVPTVLAFQTHNAAPFETRFMADYGEYGSMVVDVAHSDTLLATDFPFTNTASKLDQHGDINTADYGEYGGLDLAAPAHTGNGDTCMSRNYDSLLCHVGPNTELNLYQELDAQVSYRSMLLPPSLYRQDLMLRLQEAEA